MSPRKPKADVDAGEQLRDVFDALDELHAKIIDMAEGVDLVPETELTDPASRLGASTFFVQGHDERDRTYAMARRELGIATTMMVTLESEHAEALAFELLHALRVSDGKSAIQLTVDGRLVLSAPLVDDVARALEHTHR
jgi:hypothetical protein